MGETKRQSSAGGRTRRFFELLWLTTLVVGLCSTRSSAVGAEPGKRVLRITADPNNMPFSNERLEGFENKIAELLARDLNAEVQYTWRAQRRGFFRETLKANECDLVLGVPSGFERALTTTPYYRSSYTFVYRKDSGIKLRSLDDPLLRQLRIGVQLIGDDGANTPPAHALANRNIITNIVGYTVYGDYREPNPPARVLQAVAKGEVDVAIVWGPLAGYFAGREAAPLEVVPVSPTSDAGLPFTFNISLGVRKKDKPLRDELDSILKQRRADIEKILEDYGVPLLEIRQN